MLRDVLRKLLPDWHRRKLIAKQRAVGSGSENALQSLRRRIEMENAKGKAPNERSAIDKTRNAKPAEGQGVIVAGPDARARARGEVKDDAKPRDVPDAPNEKPPTDMPEVANEPARDT